ncbi:BNR repeat-containing protein [Paenibacillus agaridevorans]|uniref:BNR repeat-containing protein n=1 Tax=Paenibacillus agaridevorans TaxID=171404 RepID=UPI001BE40F40|nr:BNR repeat-containing protein [Paenibacillus agaridevorans]
MVNFQTTYFPVKLLRLLFVLTFLTASIIPAGMVRIASAAPVDEWNWTDPFNRADSNDVGNGWTELRGDWSLKGNALQSDNGPNEMVIAQTGQELGRTFTIEATLRNTESRWNGIAFNIADNGDGTQNYYALRMVTYPNQRPGVWQLLRVTRSTVNNESLIATGAIPVVTGKDYKFRVSSFAYGVVNLAILDGQNEFITRSVATPLNKHLIGGYAGFYSESGKLQVQDIRLTSSTEPAVAPNWLDGFDRANSSVVGNGWTELRGDWSIQGNALQSDSGPNEMVIAQTDLELGKSFAVEATLRNTESRWNGIAFNISDNGDGTQNYYALRMVTYPDQRPGVWQLLQVANSAVNGESLIAMGTIPAVTGKYYTFRISSPSYGLVNLDIYDGENKLLVRSEVTPLDKLLVGGYAGFYSESGKLQVDDIRITNSAEPAVAPVSGPLVWTPAAGTGEPYQLPTGQETIVDKSLVDMTWAGHPVGYSLLTHGNDQYVAYYNADRQMVIAHRKLDEDVWVRQPLDTFVGWDSHNYVTMALDRTGQLHVSGNMHNVPLIYFRTTTPGDVTTLTRILNMVNPAKEWQMTYPTFLSAADGSLIFRYRFGLSGNGVDLYNIYDEETQQWRGLLDQPLHDGEGLRNAYVDSPRLGPDGYYHVVWVWRDNGNAATNQRLSYARSQDLVHWEKSDGTPLTLPITYSTGEAIDSIPMNGGIINGSNMVGFDAQGRVLVSYHKYDPFGNTQIYIARLTNTGWEINQISDWTGRWNIWGHGTLLLEVTLGRVSLLPDNNLRLDFSVHGVKRTWVLNPDNLHPIAELDTPQLPSEFTEVRSDFPSMEVRWSTDLGSSGNEHERYMLRRESLPSNQDQPRNPPLPGPVPLEVYRLSSNPNAISINRNGDFANELE